MSSLEITKKGYLNLDFKLVSTCFVISIATQGFGSSIFGYNIFSDVSTLMVYLALIIQVATNTLRFSKILLLIFAFVLIQSFAYNFYNIIIVSSLKHFLGLIIFSISVFSFIAVHRDRIVEIVEIYYKFVFFITCFAILQTLICIFFDPPFVLTSLFSAIFNPPQTLFEPEILGIFPRAVGLSTEPAHYAMTALPGAFIALLVLTGKNNGIVKSSKTIAWVILIGLILSFSLVGYFGLMLCLIAVFGSNLKGRLLPTITVTLFFIGALFFVSQSNLMSKLTTLPAMVSGAGDYAYTSSDLTGFALVSNILVATEGLKKSHYLGTGINTHKDTYDETIYNQFSSSQVLVEVNKQDAGSLFIRLPSEFGIPGLLAFLLFFYHYKIGKGFKPSPIKTINLMSLVVLISYSSRNGGYLLVQLWFFAALFYYTYRLQQSQIKIVQSGQ
jgi:hypothetical protein